MLLYITSPEPSDTPPYCNSLAFEPPQGIPSITTLYYQVIIRLPSRRSRRCFDSPCVGPINEHRERLKPPLVTPGATSTFFAYSALLFLCQLSDAFSLSLIHLIINLQPPSHTVWYHAPWSSPVVLQHPVMPNTRRPSATQSVHTFSFSHGSRCPAFSTFPGMIS